MPAHQRATERLAAVKSWAYQLQNADPDEIANSPYDLVVVDYTQNGDPETPLRPADVERMKRKPGGGHRLVLAYVSLGEAEDYRFYWDESWIVTTSPAPPPTAGPQAPGSGAPGHVAPGATGPPAASATSGAAAPPLSGPRLVSPNAPSWLGNENASWSGNFAVKYWEKGWQDLIFGTPQSFVERVLALGFDGVYLDRVDAYYEHLEQHPKAAEDMIDCVVRLAAAARAARPGALVVPQNGEELLTRPSYVAAIDAIAKEDLLFGSPTDGAPNAPEQIANTLGWLSHATAAGRPVLVIEYLDKPEQATAAWAELSLRGFVPYFGPRTLDRLASPWVTPAPGKGPAALEPAPPAEVRKSPRRSGR